MIKRIQTKKVVSTVRKGVDVYYFEPEKNLFVTLEKLLATLPGVFVVDESALVEEPEVEIKTPQAKPSVNTRRKNIDVCKVISLKQEGWTTKAIADEMGVSPQAIAYHLKKMKSEVQYA